jgi:hypothetical protein
MVRFSKKKQSMTETVERGEARRHLAVDLAEHDGAVPAVEDAAAIAKMCDETLAKARVQVGA